MPSRPCPPWREGAAPTALLTTGSGAEKSEALRGPGATAAPSSERLRRQMPKAGKQQGCRRLSDSRRQQAVGASGS